jgi:hypothetical protein
MPLHDIAIGIRNILLVQLLMVLLAPHYSLMVRQELLRIWQSINAPFLLKKGCRKKEGSFWKIDMTKFEP